MTLHPGAEGASQISSRPCPSGNTHHLILDLPDTEARLAGLEPGRPVHLDRSSQPSNGDLIWAEVVRYGATQRVVRRYTRDGGWVTLSAPGGGASAIMRRQGELLVLGVVDEGAHCSRFMSSQD